MYTDGQFLYPLLSRKSDTHINKAGKVNVRVFEFEWKINVISELTKLHNDQHSLVSDSFTTNFGEEIKWWLSLRPTTDDDDCLSISLKNLVASASANNATFKVSYCLLNKNHLKVNEVMLENIQIYTVDKEVGQFVNKSFLMDEENNLIVDNHITIMCKIIFIGGEQNQESFSRLHEFDDFEKLLLNQKFSDLTVISADEKKMHVHKAILASRSPVFEAMFEHDMAEKSQSIVTIEDFEFDVLLEMFRFIYCGKVNEIDAILCQLLKAAEKYSVEGLKLMCEETMVDQLSEDNAIEFLVEADKNNAVFSKIRVIKFIAVNLKSFLKKSEFRSLGITHYDLLYEILSAVAEEKEFE